MDDNKNRNKYWEIDYVMSCPVVGTCLSLAEQKKILKKSGVSIADFNDYEIHQMLVQSGKNESPISQRVQRALENKYKQEIAELGNCNEEIFLAHWKKGLCQGEIGGLLWIGATNRSLSLDVVTRIFGDYHMHTHGQGMIIRRQLQQVDSLQAQNQQLTAKLKQTRAQKQEAIQALKSVERERDRLQQQIEALQRENQVLQNRSQEQRLQHANDTLEYKIGTLENKVETQNETLSLSDAENSRLMTLVEEQTKLIQHLQTEFKWLTQETDDELACSSCSRRDFCPYRILIVGGLNTLRPHYQNLVENGGGQFKYFDSFNGSSERALRPMISWADVILCPIDFNSHRACLSVKKLCKKMQKPYRMLSNSSISNVSRVLENVSTNLST